MNSVQATLFQATKFWSENLESRVKPFVKRSAASLRKDGSGGIADKGHLSAQRRVTKRIVASPDWLKI